MSIEQSLAEAKSHIHKGQKAEARVILSGILRESPQIEEAWILSAQVSDKTEQVLYCLRQALKINPSSSRARIMLEQIQAGPSAHNTSVPPPPKAHFTTPDTDHRQTPSQPQSPQNQVSPTFSHPPAPKLPTSTPPGNGIPPKAYVNHHPTPSNQENPSKRPKRWWQRLLTIAGIFCIWMPWVLIQSGCNGTREISGAEVLQESLQSSPNMDFVIAAPAILILIIMVFMKFKTRTAQKWAERTTIALVPLAAFPAMDLIASYYFFETNIVELRWGVWVNWILFSLVGIFALANARKIGKLKPTELSAASVGKIFTWIISITDVLIILLAAIGLGATDAFNISALVLPATWLTAGAILSHTA